MCNVASIPSRWKKDDVVKGATNIGTGGATKSQVQKRVVKKVMFEQDRYLTAHAVTESLCCFIANCGGNDFQIIFNQLRTVG